ncbi:hypothetical protein GCM10010276_38260 [Streptomyces longisporus]|uniref:Oxidoreductase FAD/NAD(P)-binding domain-containing protein n=1 Tax=Streptomyces longisporus TaxID=1948 RepID=A0ABN3M1M0_STRLO
MDADDGHTLRLTAKAVGSASAGLRHLSVGSRAFVEGPYGAFTSLHRTRPGALLIAGGVGITPVRALLEEELSGDAVVLYRVRSENEAVLADEVRALVAARGGKLHLLTGLTGEGSSSFEPDSLPRCRFPRGKSTPSGSVWPEPPARRYRLNKAGRSMDHPREVHLPRPAAAPHEHHDRYG